VDDVQHIPPHGPDVRLRPSPVVVIVLRLRVEPGVRDFGLGVAASGSGGRGRGGCLGGGVRGLGRRHRRRHLRLHLSAPPAAAATHPAMRTDPNSESRGCGGMGLGLWSASSVPARLVRWAPLLAFLGQNLQPDMF
jgi:hypothetical protein